MPAQTPWKKPTKDLASDLQKKAKQNKFRIRYLLYALLCAGWGDAVVGVELPGLCPHGADSLVREETQLNRQHQYNYDKYYNKRTQ